jgi:hypothetical protein
MASEEARRKAKDRAVQMLAPLWDVEDLHLSARQMAAIVAVVEAAGVLSTNWPREMGQGDAGIVEDALGVAAAYTKLEQATMEAE